MINQCFVCLSPLAALLAASVLFAQTAIDQRIIFSGGHEHEVELAEGQAVEVSVGIRSPSQLPANGRLAVEWNGPAADLGFRKVLHALDPDVYVIYRAPQAGKYTLALKTVEDEEPAGSSPRWRETGALTAAKTFPKLTPWPVGHSVDMCIFVKPVDFGPSAGGHLVELEPNNSIAQAQTLPIAATDDDQVLRLTGGADDIEYFDNNHYGQSGDDWFRLEFAGTAERLLSVNLMPTDPLVAARVRVFKPGGEEFSDGKHLNETAHEQVEEHRTAVVRTLRPGAVLLLRVEANSPGYDLEIRVRRPAPSC